MEDEVERTRKHDHDPLLGHGPTPRRFLLLGDGQVFGRFEDYYSVLLSRDGGACTILCPGRLPPPPPSFFSPPHLCVSTHPATVSP
jgi:hypothetical protein